MKSMYELALDRFCRWVDRWLCPHVNRMLVGTAWSGTHDRGGYWHDVYTCQRCKAVIVTHRHWVGVRSYGKRQPNRTNKFSPDRGKQWVEAAESWNALRLGVVQEIQQELEALKVAASSRHCRCLYKYGGIHTLTEREIETGVCAKCGLQIG